VYLKYDLNVVGYRDESRWKRKALHPDEIRRVEQPCAAKFGAQYHLQAIRWRGFLATRGVDDKAMSKKTILKNGTGEARLIGTPPRVGVFITCYNYGRFVAEALESVMARVTSHWMSSSWMTVVAMTPRDHRAVPVPFQRGRRTAFYRQPVNGGKNAALNAVMHEITAPYMLSLDADDQLEPDYVERCLQALLEARAEDPRVAMVYTDCLLIDAAGRAIDRGGPRLRCGQAADPVVHSEPALCLSEACLEVMPFRRQYQGRHKAPQVVAHGGARLERSLHRRAFVPLPHARRQPFPHRPAGAGGN